MVPAVAVTDVISAAPDQQVAQHQTAAADMTAAAVELAAEMLAAAGVTAPDLPAAVPDMIDAAAR